MAYLYSLPNDKWVWWEPVVVEGKQGWTNINLDSWEVALGYITAHQLDPHNG